MHRAQLCIRSWSIVPDSGGPNSRFMCPAGRLPLHSSTVGTAYTASRCSLRCTRSPKSFAQIVPPYASRSGPSRSTTLGVIRRGRCDVNFGATASDRSNARRPPAGCTRVATAGLRRERQVDRRPRPTGDDATFYVDVGEMHAITQQGCPCT
jgi:hypothetical protein